MQRFLIALVFIARCYAALPQTTVWEVRPTVGSDTTAGACFVSGSSGTDYSQQNAAQYTAADLATSGATSIVVSVSHSFVAADVGNCLHITTTGTGALFIVGYYQIVSVSTGLATLDRPCASTAAAAAGTYYVGGAGATPANANANATAGNTVWVKATGTYTVTSAMTFSLNSGSATDFIPFRFIGYTSTRGDNGQFTWTTATNSIDLVDFTAATNVTFENVIFTSTAGTPGSGFNASATGNTSNLTVLNCKFSGFGNAILGNFSVDWSFDGLFVVNSRITASTGTGIINTLSTYILGSLIDNNGLDGAQWQANAAADSSSWVVDNSIFYKNASFGLALASLGGGQPIAVINHSSFSTNLDGIDTGDTLVPTVQISNSIFDANTNYGIATGQTTNIMPWQLYTNAFYNNGSGPTQGVNAGIGTITLTASPYVSLGSLNFALNTTAGGGALLNQAGFPGILANGGGTGYTSVGALDPMSGSSGGGAHAYPVVQ
jgi:hypothetical protein